MDSSVRIVMQNDLRFLSSSQRNKIEALLKDIDPIGLLLYISYVETDTCYEILGDRVLNAYRKTDHYEPMSREGIRLRIKPVVEIEKAIDAILIGGEDEE